MCKCVTPQQRPGEACVQCLSMPTAGLWGHHTHRHLTTFHSIARTSAAAHGVCACMCVCTAGIIIIIVIITTTNHTVPNSVPPQRVAAGQPLAPALSTPCHTNTHPRHREGSNSSITAAQRQGAPHRPQQQAPVPDACVPRAQAKGPAGSHVIQSTSLHTPHRHLHTAEVFA